MENHLHPMPLHPFQPAPGTTCPVVACSVAAPTARRFSTPRNPALWRGTYPPARLAARRNGQFVAVS
eukprot:scaffold16886_cov101-Isochrysis_galbana.AAC.1